jgi:hypothetical protein
MRRSVKFKFFGEGITRMSGQDPYRSDFRNVPDDEEEDPFKAVKELQNEEEPSPGKVEGAISKLIWSNRDAQDLVKIHDRVDIIRRNLTTLAEMVMREDDIPYQYIKKVLQDIIKLSEPADIDLDATISEQNLEDGKYGFVAREPKITFGGGDFKTYSRYLGIVRDLDDYDYSQDGVPGNIDRSRRIDIVLTKDDDGNWKVSNATEMTRSDDGSWTKGSQIETTPAIPDNTTDDKELYDAIQAFSKDKYPSATVTALFNGNYK